MTIATELNNDENKNPLINKFAVGARTKRTTNTEYHMEWNDENKNNKFIDNASERKKKAQASACHDDRSHRKNTDSHRNIVSGVCVWDWCWAVYKYRFSFPGQCLMKN